MGGGLNLQSLLRRLAQSLATLIAVTVLLFGLLHAIPGGPLQSLMGEAVGGDPAAAEHAEALPRRGRPAPEAPEAPLGVAGPPLERYLGWLGGLLVGDLGASWVVAPGRPVGG